MEESEMNLRVALLSDFLGYSGGDYVNIVMIKSLLEQGYIVDVYTDNRNKLQYACKAFEEYEVYKYINVFEFKTRLPSAFFTYMLSRHLNEKRQYSTVILNDDIPKTARNLDNSSVKYMTYVHFPYAARVKYNVLIDKKYTQTLKGRLKFVFYKAVFPKLFCMNESPGEGHLILANSSLTYVYSRHVWPDAKIKILYPPVQAHKIANYVEKKIQKRKDQVVYVGRIMPDKCVEDIVNAMALIKKKNVKVKLLGPVVDERYARWLKGLARKKSLLQKIELTGLISRKVLIQTLMESKVLVHPSIYEPFGISVVEGMASGCIPIVKKAANGPWLDILGRKETYGYGYTSVLDLAEKIEAGLEDPMEKRREITGYSLRFDEEAFTKKFIYNMEMLKLEE